MKEKIFNYLTGELYPLPSCDNCHYNNPQMKRVPCDKCDKCFSRFKLREGIKADIRKMTKEIMKIVKENGNGKT